MSFATGDEVEAKRTAGLGGYERGRIVSTTSRAALVRFTRDGVELPVALSRVRVARAQPGRESRAAAATVRVPVPIAATPAEALGRAREAFAITTAAELRPVPKPRAPIRSSDFLAFVRARACCGCGKAGPNDPHHYGARGIGQKTDDLRAVPLCRACHDGFHDRAFVPQDRIAVDPVRSTRERFLTAQVDALIDWVART